MQGVGAQGVWSSERRALTLGLVLTITLVAFESLAVATVMPDVSDDLGDLGLYGWVFSGFFLGQLVGIVAAGQSADRHGPARPFTIALVLFAAGLFLAGIAPSMPVLVAARCMQGIGGGAIPAIAYVSVGRGYPAAMQPRVFAVFSSAWIVPGLVGPPVAATVSEHTTWRVVFLGLLPLVLLAGAIAIPSLRRLPAGRAVSDPAGRTDRLRDALHVTLGAALVLGGASSGRPLLAAVLAIPGFVIGTRAFIRLVPPGTMRARAGLPSAIAARGLLTFAFFGADAYVTLALTSVRDTSLTVAGLSLTVTSIAWAAAAWVQERLVGRVGPRRLVRTGFVAIAVAGAAMVLSLWDAVPVALAVGVWAIAGFGMGLAYAPLSLTVLASAEPGREGDATASLQLSDVLGVALGTGASGAVIAIGDALDWSNRTPLVIAFAVSAVSGLFGALVAQRLPVSVSQRPGTRAAMDDEDDEIEEIQPPLDAEGIPDLEGPLPAKILTGDPQEGIYPPQDDYVAADAHGVTPREEREGESLDEKLARELPDPTLEP